MIMDFKTLAKSRYSVRAYQPDPVEAEKLQQILEVVQSAPTAANRQPFRLVIIHTEGREAELRQIYHRSWFTEAPVIICVCAVHKEGWVRSSDGKNFTLVDVAIAMDHLTLAAADLGLGTCWVANFNPQAARQILCLPEGVEPVVFTPLGYPADQPEEKERKTLEDLVHYERW
jgi:nitroreductase